MRHSCSITTLQYKQSLPNNRASAHPRNRAVPTGHRDPPNSFLMLRETPYTTLLVFPGLYPTSRPLSYPARVGIPNYLGLTLLPGLVRRPRHLPLGCQLRSPEPSTHDSLSIYRNAELFRTRHTSLPDSTASRIQAKLTNSPLPPQEVTTRPAAVSSSYATPDHCLCPVSSTIHIPQLHYPNIYICSI